MIVWRFTGSRMLSQRAEERAQKLVAVQFFILAPYVAVESIRALVNGSRTRRRASSASCWPRASLVLMPLAGPGKAADRRAASAPRPRRAKGKQNLLCAYLAAALLVGLLGNALLGAWWLDSMVALLIAAVAVHEGREAWRGEACCHH